MNSTTISRGEFSQVVAVRFANSIPTLDCMAGESSRPTDHDGGCRWYHCRRMSLPCTLATFPPLAIGEDLVLIPIPSTMQTTNRELFGAPCLRTQVMSPVDVDTCRSCCRPARTRCRRGCQRRFRCARTSP
jgi:hypothetical protein